MDRNDTDEKKPLSFGFSKRQETKQLGSSAVGDHLEKEDDSKDFVLSVEKNKVQSTKPTQQSKSKEYIIPLIKQNKWRQNGNDKDEQSDNPDNLDLIAAREILEESARLNEDWDEKGTVDSTTSIPLLMQNKVPEGFETDNSLNVDLRPEVPKDADYDQIPIEHFGMALLRGMGWKEGMGVGRKAKEVAPVEAQLRPKGLGLGADKSMLQKNDKHSSQKTKEGEEKLDFKKGTHCVVLSGHNKDLYGTIEGIDEDNARAMVKLSLSGKVVNLMQGIIRLVSKKDFEKHSKYLNKVKVDQYKKDEELKKSASNRERSNDDRNGKDHRDDRGNGDYHGHSSKRKKKTSNDDRDRDGKDHRKDSRRSEKRSKHSSDEEKSKKNKHHKKHKSSNRSPEYSSSEDSLPDTKMQRRWIRKDLRVRIIDKNLKGGKYYKEKVIVEDVPSPSHCVCKTSDGRVIENVSQSSLETVVPRADDSIVVIIKGSGSYNGQFGRIMKRDKERCLALVQILTDQDVVLKLSYDEICEYLGDVRHLE